MRRKAQRVTNQAAQDAADEAPRETTKAAQDVADVTMRADCHIAIEASRGLGERCEAASGEASATAARQPVAAATEAQTGGPASGEDGGEADRAEPLEGASPSPPRKRQKQKPNQAPRKGLRAANQAA